MNHIRWAAWGVIDIEKLERMQRRNYIKRTRKELEEKNIKLDCGGSKTQPYYMVVLPGEDLPRKAYGGVDAFKKACQWLLEQLGEGATPDERSEDGGVRGAGDEAQGS